MSFQDWNNLFQNSTAVHFASSQTSLIANIGKITISKKYFLIKIFNFFHPKMTRSTPPMPCWAHVTVQYLTSQIQTSDG